MRTRRDFVCTSVGAAASLYAAGFAPVHAQPEGQAPGRRQVTIGGKRIRVIDIHCHCVIDVTDIVKGTPLEKEGGGGGTRSSGRNVFSSWTRQASTCRR